MSLSSQAIQEFKEIYFRETGKQLSDQEAAEKASRVLSLFKVIYRPIPEKPKP